MSRAQRGIRFRPYPLSPIEVQRSSRALQTLIAAPADWLRRLHSARIDVAVRPRLAPHRHAALQAAGFAPLCVAVVRHPGIDGVLDQSVDVWIDRTTSIRAEVFDRTSGRVYLSSLYDDGCSLISMADHTAATWLRSGACEVIEASGHLSDDLLAFRARASWHEVSGRVALLCPDPATYQLHVRAAALRSSRHPGVGVRRGDSRLMFPMTLMLAAEAIARREAAARGRQLQAQAPRELGA